MKTISFINNKGGVLKTSLVTNIAGVLATKNKKVLILDTDPQGSSIGRFGRNSDDEKHNLTDIFMNKSKIEEGIKWVYERNIAVISSDFSLSMIDNFILSNQLKPEDITKKMSEIINYAQKEFDYVLIDSAPTFGRMTNEVLKISDEIIIPSSLEQDSFKGTTTVINVLKSMQMEQKLKYIIPTLLKSRTNLHKNLLEQWLKPLAKVNNVKVTKNMIKDSIRVATSTALDKLPITLTKSKHQAKMVYFDLSKELGVI